MEELNNLKGYRSTGRFCRFPQMGVAIVRFFVVALRVCVTPCTCPSQSCSFWLGSRTQSSQDIIP